MQNESLMAEILLLKYDQCFFVVVQNEAIRAKYQCLTEKIKLGFIDETYENALDQCETEYDRVVTELGESMGCPANQRKRNMEEYDALLTSQ